MIKSLPSLSRNCKLSLLKETISMKITVAGHGVWGSALFHVLSQNNTDVHFCERGKPFTTDVLVLALPTSSIRDVLSLVTFSNERKIIINTCKGIEKATHMFPHEIVEEVMGKTTEYYCLMGPSFAEEVSHNMPTLVNLGYSDGEEKMNKIKSLFQTDYFRVRATKSIEGLEIAGAFKNIYAVACGLTDGLGYAMNTRVKVMVLAIEELRRLCNGLNLSLDEYVTPELIGDLILTCNSTMSRNFQFGRFLSTHSVEESLVHVNSTVEGHNTSFSVGHLEKKSQTKLPVAKFVTETIKLNNPQQVKERFLSLLRTS